MIEFLIRCIDDVSRIIPLKEDLILSYRREVRRINCRSGSVLWKSHLDGMIAGCHLFEERLYVEFFDPMTGFEKTTLLNASDGEESATMLAKCLIRDVAPGIAIAVLPSIENAGEICLIDMREEQIMWQERFRAMLYFVDPTRLVGFDKESVICKDKSGVERWQFDCSTLGVWHQYSDGKEMQTQVRRLLGTYKGKLYVLLNSNKILVLDGETGDRVEILSNDGWTKYGTFDYGIELDHANGVLIQLFRQDYTEIDLSSHQISNIRSIDMVSRSVESRKGIVFDNEYIYFSDDHHGKLGAFNRTTHVVDWIYDLIEVEPRVEGRFIRNLKLRDNQLLALDNQNVLHILERTGAKSQA